MKWIILIRAYYETEAAAERKNQPSIVKLECLSE